MTAIEVLKLLPSVFRKEAVGDTSIVLQYAITTPAYVTIANGTCTVTEGKAEKPTVTLTMTDDTLIKTMTGRLNPVMAYMSGKLRASGDLLASQKVSSAFDTAKLAELVKE